jgi:hypothetical protein
MVAACGSGRAMHERVVFRNYFAIFLWVFMAIWMTMLAIFTWLAIRDGGIPEMHPMLATTMLAVFWVAGVGFTAAVLQMPCYRLVVELGMVEAVRFTPLRRESERHRARSLKLLPIVDGKDSDGDPYFKARVETPTGLQLTIAESNDRSMVEAALSRIGSIVGKPTG